MIDHAVFLARRPEAEVLLLGFSDRTGDAAYNVRLSRHRATTIAGASRSGCAEQVGGLLHAVDPSLLPSHAQRTDSSCRFHASRQFDEESSQACERLRDPIGNDTNSRPHA